MSWSPTTLISTCLNSTSSAYCPPQTLAFLSFLTHYAGYSLDEDYGRFNNEDTGNTYDFIIVGGGSAGCVLANRLSEIKGWKVRSYQWLCDRKKFF